MNTLSSPTNKFRALLKTSLPILLLLLIPINSLHFVYADNDSGEGGDGKNDLYKTFGSAAIGFLAIGAIYVLMKRAFVYSKWIPNEYEDVRTFIKASYRRYRKPSAIIHDWAMIAATVAAIVHGYGLWSGFGIIGTFGLVAVVAMVLMTFSGIFMWFKFKPFWDYKSSRTFVRFVHRQWIFTGIMLLGILLHFAGGD